MSEREALEDLVLQSRIEALGLVLSRDGAAVAAPDAGRSRLFVVGYRNLD